MDSSAGLGFHPKTSFAFEVFLTLRTLPIFGSANFISLLKLAKNFAVHLGRFIFGALLKPFFLKSLATSLYHRSFSERANL